MIYSAVCFNGNWRYQFTLANHCCFTVCAVCKSQTIVQTNSVFLTVDGLVFLTSRVNKTKQNKTCMWYILIHANQCNIPCMRPNKIWTGMLFCEARTASHCHSPQTTYSSKSICCVLSTQKSAMHVVVYADRLTTQHSIVDIIDWSWSYRQI